MEENLKIIELDVEQKLSLWKHYDDHANSIDIRLISVATLAATIFPAMSLFIGDKSKIIYLMPALTVIFMYYMSYQQRVVAILRGFLL